MAYRRLSAKSLGGGVPFPPRGWEGDRGVEGAIQIGILGLGSVLMGDDAVGPYAVELLTARWTLPPEVSALDAGTPGPDLADYLVDLDAAIVVDTVRVPGESWLRACDG
ncbi:MAG TPA: hydrogenase maturation protease, partial [Thermoanaerobaculia bacterium]|nr:hydrogenase maturation protease [Thermoanaerobaculia bacterium]